MTHKRLLFWVPIQVVAVALYLVWMDIYRDYYYSLVSHLCLSDVCPLMCFYEINKYRL